MTADADRLTRIALVWERAAPVLTSSWLVGTLVAVAAWRPSFTPPSGGIDGSWITGLYMAADRGLDFGTQVIWTYGPLGFLVTPWLMFRSLGVMAFVWESALLVALCVSLIWALRRSVGLAVAAALTYLTITLGDVATGLNTAFPLAAVWCLAALAPDPPPYAARVVALGGGAFGAILCLGQLSIGPAVVLMSAITLAALPTWRRELPRFAASTLGTFAVLWFATGQGIGNLPDYVSSAREVVSGYSQAMGVDSEPDWYIYAAIEILVILVAWSVASAAPGRRRAAAGAVMALGAFVVFKEGVVRFDVHIEIFFTTAAALALAIPWRRAFLPAAAVAFLAPVALTLYTTSVSADSLLNPVPRIKRLGDSVRLAVDSGRWNQYVASDRAGLRASYALDRRTLARLRGHPVDIWPEEATVAWAYKLDWRPEPVFQSYGAYTSALDSENARFLASQPRDQRILRASAGSIDGRNPIWDPPLTVVTMLCHYAPLRTTERWQVLGKAADRCGPERLLSSTTLADGDAVKVPKAPAGAAVVAKVHGAGVSGLDSIRTFFFRAAIRRALVNGATTYRLVPGTAADGLLMSVPKRADFPGVGFGLSPDVRHLSLSGAAGGAFKIDFYALPIRPWRPSGP